MQGALELKPKDPTALLFTATVILKKNDTIADTYFRQAMSRYFRQAMLRYFDRPCYATSDRPCYAISDRPCYGRNSSVCTIFSLHVCVRLLRPRCALRWNSIVLPSHWPMLPCFYRVFVIRISLGLQHFCGTANYSV